MGTLPARSREDILCSWLKNNGSRELGDVCPHAWSHARRSRTCGTRQANGLRRVDTWWKANEQHRDGLVTLSQKDHLLPRHLAPARTTPERSLGMRQENVDAPNVEDGGQQTARLSMPAEGSSAAALSGEAACRTLSVAVLAARCLEEIDTSRRGSHAMRPTASNCSAAPQPRGSRGLGLAATLLRRDRARLAAPSSESSGSLPPGERSDLRRAGLRALLAGNCRDAAGHLQPAFCGLAVLACQPARSHSGDATRQRAATGGPLAGAG